MLIVLVILVVVSALTCWGIYTYRKNKSKDAAASLRKAKKYPPQALRDVLQGVVLTTADLEQTFKK